MLGIHHLQHLDVRQGQLRHPSLRFAEHFLRKIDPDYAIVAGIVGERDTGTDTDLENSAPHSLGCSDRRPPPALEYGAKDKLVDGRPARIRLPYTDLVDFPGQFLANSIRHETFSSHISRPSRRLLR